jgi:hypothetical protein
MSSRAVSADAATTSVSAMSGATKKRRVPTNQVGNKVCGFTAAKDAQRRVFKFGFRLEGMAE